MLLAQFNMWFCIALTFPSTVSLRAHARSRARTCMCACTTRCRSLFSLSILAHSQCIVVLIHFANLLHRRYYGCAVGPPTSAAFAAAIAISFLFCCCCCLVTRNSNFKVCNYIIVWAMLDAHIFIHVTDKT